MDKFLPTIILRHKKENLKKCSLKGLEGLPNFEFYSYPPREPLLLTNYITLDLEAEELTFSDRHLGLFILDGTWKYAKKMALSLEDNPQSIRRSIPKDFRTAYPRKQTECSDPARGLASIEAIYIAHKILKRDHRSLLDGYHWKDLFLQINKEAFYNLELRSNHVSL